MLATPPSPGLVPPPRGNPGSATGIGSVISLTYCNLFPGDGVSFTFPKSTSAHRNKAKVSNYVNNFL